MTASARIDEAIVMPPRAARLAVIVFFMINGLLFATWIVRIPDLKAQLRLSDAQLGLALLGAPAGVVLGQIVIGSLLPRLGSRAVSTLMAAALCLFFPFLGLASGLLSLLLLVFLYGLLSGGMDVAMNAQATQVEKVYGRPIMASFHGMWSVAGLLAAAIGGWLTGRHEPVELHFLGLAALSLPLIAVAQRWLVGTRPTKVAGGQAFVLPPRSLLPLGMIVFSVLLCEGAVGDWSGVYLRESLGGSPAVAASAFTVFSLLMTVGRLTGDWLTMRIGPAWVVRGGGLLVIAGISLVVLAHAPVVAVAGFGLIGAGVACPFPLVLSAASRAPGRLGPSGRGHGDGRL
jgi:fucose permease